ncbi:L,D-transpeptidase family protein [Acidithiobacillus sp. M4-SHS-6]|uniref:L,D-transpeptidase family protein n=1 Tax=Acidithiobacillus sp. M4-SHS-6 TaxID=3383024 RepID=UPI0039BEC811
MRRLKNAFAIVFFLLMGVSFPLAQASTYLLPPPGDNLVGAIQSVTARHEDTLSDIARQYDLGYDQITAANPEVDPWLPGEGTRIVLPTEYVLPDVPRQGMVINLAAMRLFYYPPVQAGQAPEVITYPIGVGREGWGTPLGKTRITAKLVDPSWTPPESIRKEHAENGDPLPAVVPAGPDNPLGQFALRLALPGYLIHGTNKPWGVGMHVSHGCIRLYPEDIAALFAQVPVGTPVLIVNQPWLLGLDNGHDYLQIFSQTSEPPEPQIQKAFSAWLARHLPPGKAIDSSIAQRWLKAANGIPEPL